jgi:hypothetical protein
MDSSSLAVLLGGNGPSIRPKPARTAAPNPFAVGTKLTGLVM